MSPRPFRAPGQPAPKEPPPLQRYPRYWSPPKPGRQDPPIRKPPPKSEA